jgi:hypothetical protein
MALRIERDKAGSFFLVPSFNVHERRGKQTEKTYGPYPDERTAEQAARRILEQPPELAAIFPVDDD